MIELTKVCFIQFIKINFLRQLSNLPSILFKRLESTFLSWIKKVRHQNFKIAWLWCSHAGGMCSNSTSGKII